MAHAIETVAAIPLNQNGFVHRFHAAASEAAAEFAVKQEKERGFDARVREVNDEELEAILRGEWNGFLPTNKLPQGDDYATGRCGDGW